MSRLERRGRHGEEGTGRPSGGREEDGARVTKRERERLMRKWWWDKRERREARELASSRRIRGGLTIRLISQACSLPLAGQGGFNPPLYFYSFSSSYPRCTRPRDRLPCLFGETLAINSPANVD